jgi:RNA polymerase sigma-70 factor (ECF subfamily)
VLQHLLTGEEHGRMVRGKERDDEFRSYYTRFHDRAVATAARLVRDQDLAEDLAAEALARAYASWQRLRRHPNPDAWLMTVIGNLAIDHVRRASRPVQREGTSSQPRPDEQATLRIDLADALETLSNRQRDIVLMRYLADLSEAEVASALGLSNGAVKSHLHRATTKLRSCPGGPVPESCGGDKWLNRPPRDRSRIRAIRRPASRR